jgi:hypothetical protein
MERSAWTMDNRYNASLLGHRLKKVLFGHVARDRFMQPEADTGQCGLRRSHSWCMYLIRFTFGYLLNPFEADTSSVTSDVRVRGACTGFALIGAV